MPLEPLDIWKDITVRVYVPAINAHCRADLGLLPGEDLYIAALELAEEYGPESYAERKVSGVWERLTRENMNSYRKDQ